MMKLKVLIPILLTMTLTIFVYANNNDNVNYNPNHPEIFEGILFYKMKDKELNVVYRILMDAFKQHGVEAGEKLKKAQLAWIKYRDLEIDSESARMVGGNPEHEVRLGIAANLTTERTSRMKATLDSMCEDYKLQSRKKELTQVKNALEQIKRMEEVDMKDYNYKINKAEEDYRKSVQKGD